MELVTPGIGLIFWMLLSFSLVLIILKKYAWKPVLQMLKEREENIENSLKSAEKAKDEMAKLQTDNERILNEARKERDLLIKEAREIKEKIIFEAKSQASIEAGKLIENSKAIIQSEKMAALTDIKNQISFLSVEIAEKILKKELLKDANQKEFIESLIKDINLN
ncbi:MAG: ATP synthase F0 subunit B [Bacteroidetes bacterium CG02_land_8_20_14_3_00_31_25]|nr:F0F1 ATP synthase subunit B [Bacteroidota bacterium]PIV59739.1 MAG: ATP synthase F0 subunit B [Bacteroidetes bacterium CG02_land_8_20_14_3_00_31_25]PIX34293.1 MAG: ATP synthase F0 subunit B [Bacteroidetes bacterium CG_4_8_14_3_um_filter_31_14]PIY04598.1 MAG: ATP synthase F0 subunit B [Bacteroidetes bacterium CG_4_10_14_3_um_filter_31_20]